MPAEQQARLDKASAAFSALFVAEAAPKLAGIGVSYFRDPLNCLDLVLTLTSAVDLVLRAGGRGALPCRLSVCLPPGSLAVGGTASLSGLQCTVAGGWGLRPCTAEASKDSEPSST